MRDTVVDAVAVGLHAEELGGDELAVLGVPGRQTEHRGGVGGERTARMLVGADGDADVVLAGADAVGGLFDRAGRGGTGVEHVGEGGDAGQAHQACHGVGVVDLVAAADSELDVLPGDAGVGECELDGVGGHLDGRLRAEPAERVQAHPPDDGNVVHVSRNSSIRVWWSDRLERPGDDLGAVLVGVERDEPELELHARPELVRIVLGEAGLDAHHVAQLDESECEGRERLCGFAAGVGLLRDEALCRPRDERSAAGGSSSSDMFGPLHRGQRGCCGQVVAAQSSQ